MASQRDSLPSRGGCLAGAWALAIAAALGSAGALAQAPVEDKGSLDARLQRMERLLSSSGMMQLLESVERLQKEMRNLRGELEVQNHTLKQLQARQRELYLDMDRRLQGVESRSAAAPRSPLTPPAVVAAAPPAPRAATAPAAPAPAPAPPAAGAPATSPPAPAGGTAVAAAPPPAPATDPVAEQQAYQSAFNLLKTGRYEQAGKAFGQFLAEHPGGKYSDNAQYWLGETYYVTRQFESALREFETLLARYPESQKRTHAMLKMGYINDELGQAEAARRILGELVERYPNSTAAGLARKRLARLKSN